MKPSQKYRTWLLWLAVVRVVLGIAAIPLAPFLYKEHFLWLVFLRPTKEVFLAGGFLWRQGDVNPVTLFIAAIPLSILGVWNFYGLGKGYAKEICNDELGGIAGRILDPKRVQTLNKALDKKGPRLVLLGRMAAMSSALVAAAAGIAEMPSKRFFRIDAVGGVLSFALATGAGYALGEAYEKAGPWLTGLGVLALAGFSIILGRSLKKA